VLCLYLILTYVMLDFSLRMDTVEEHFHPINHRLEVEGMDMVDTDMGG
jgi:hypothetical protein